MRRHFWGSARDILNTPDVDKFFLAYGGGVNSTALLLFLYDEGIIDDTWEVVHCDTGAEMPQTSAYIRMLQEAIPITIIQGIAEGKTLYDNAMAKKELPSAVMRWCTSRHKIRPLHRYYKRRAQNKEYVEVIGFSADEAHRSENDHGDRRWFPLIDLNWSRSDCIDYIDQSIIPVPDKSSCFICPFKRKEEFRRMARDHPDVFQKAVALEEACAEEYRKQGKKPRWLLRRGGPLRSIASQYQLFDV